MFESVSQLLLHIIQMIKSTNSFSYYEYVVHLYIASLFIANYISNKNNQESFGSVGFIYFFFIINEEKMSKGIITDSKEIYNSMSFLWIFWSFCIGSIVENISNLTITRIIWILSKVLQHI